MYKNFLIVLAVLLLVGAGPIKMDLNAKYGASNFHTKGAEAFAELVKKYTNGEVEITVHAGSSLVKGNPLKAVKDGTVAMTDMFIPFTSGGGKVFGVSALPFIANSYDEAFRLYQTSKHMYKKLFRKWNQKLLYAVSWPPSGLYTKKPIRSIADFKGLKTRTYDKNSANFINMAGGNAIALPWAEVYSALRTGLVNSVVTSSASGKDGKFWEVLDNFTKINYAYPLQAVTINRDYWKSMSKKQQHMMSKAAAEIEKAQWQASKDENMAALKLLAENNIKISEASPQLKKELDDIAQKLLAEYLKGADKKIKKIFKKHRK